MEHRMNRYSSLLLCLVALSALGYTGYLSSQHGSTPQVKALAATKALRAGFDPNKNNVALLDRSWEKVNALLKQQGPSANQNVTSAIVQAFTYYQKVNNAWDPKYERVNPTVRDYTRRIADAWVDTADAAMAGDEPRLKAKRTELTNLHLAMQTEIDRIDPRFMVERWKP
jgi:hypothetical protein